MGSPCILGFIHIRCRMRVKHIANLHAKEFNAHTNFPSHPHESSKHHYQMKMCSSMLKSGIFYSSIHIQYQMDLAHTSMVMGSICILSFIPSNIEHMYTCIQNVIFLNIGKESDTKRIYTCIRNVMF